MSVPRRGQARTHAHYSKVSMQFRHACFLVFQLFWNVTGSVNKCNGISTSILFQSVTYHHWQLQCLSFLPGPITRVVVVGTQENPWNLIVLKTANCNILSRFFFLKKDGEKLSVLNQQRYKRSKSSIDFRGKNKVLKTDYSPIIPLANSQKRFL